MRWTSVVALLVATAAAGCNAEPAVSTVTTDATGPLAGQVSETTGAIEGVVVDESLAPLAGATVEITATSLEAQTPASHVTGPAGDFAFSHLPAGAYRLSANAETFAATVLFTDVAAGEVTRLSVQMSAVPRQEPYFTIFQEAGIVECQLELVATGMPCPNPDGSFSISRMSFEIPDGFVAIVFETAWEGFSDSMRVDLDLDDEAAFGSTQEPFALYHGTSPLRFVLYPGYQAPHISDATTVARPVPLEGFSLASIVQWLGSGQESVNESAGPACEAHPLGYCGGAGAALDLRYTNYVSVFVYGAPPNVEQFSAIPDQ